MKLIKVIWIVAMFVNLSAVIWYILGSTAGFQRGMDLISTLILVYIGIPSLLLVVLSAVLLLKGWSPSSGRGILFILLISACMIFLSPILYKNVNVIGWLVEHVTADNLQVTSDGDYEYKLELINALQKNSYARLYLKNISTAKETRIPLEMPINKIKVLFLGDNRYWVNLESTSKKDIYMLTTTTDFPLPNERFEINVSTGKAIGLK
ncbi:hypothetical protein [Paenibacillus medicaginis]|uniref:Uncharacterized protein n=1 Tax=Paenibacillus medicaginis TaxID=1470560 RepID=A0ABV5C9L3_9BACL